MQSFWRSNKYMNEYCKDFCSCTAFERFRNSHEWGFFKRKFYVSSSQIYSQIIASAPRPALTVASSSRELPCTWAARSFRASRRNKTEQMFSGESFSAEHCYVFREGFLSWTLFKVSSWDQPWRGVSGSCWTHGSRKNGERTRRWWRVNSLVWSFLGR